MKSCLKTPSLPPSPNQECCPRKCVAFCAEGSEQVFPADDWDRTPAEPAQKLTYSDILELKEIQRSLPTAPQTPDPLCKRQQTQLLNKVPINLLPLLPETVSCRDTPPSPTSPSFSTSNVPTTPYAVTFKARPQLKPWRPPPNPGTQMSNHSRPNSRFAFLPLLDASSSANQSQVDSPPSSPRTFAEFEASLELGNDKVLYHHGPPMPTFTNASLGSSPSESSTPPRGPFDPFRVPSSPPADISLGMGNSGSYFPPFSAPSSTVPSPEHNGPSIHPDPKAPNLRAPSLPITVSPSPLAPTSSESAQPVRNRPQTYTQLHGSTQGRMSHTPSFALGDMMVEVARENGGVTGRNSLTLSPEPTPPPSFISTQASPPPILRTSPPPPDRTSHQQQQRWRSVPENIAPFFAFERAAANFSRTTSSPPPVRMTSPTRSRDFQPPSPILAPYCAPMRSRSSPCSSPVIVPLNKGRRAGVGT